MGSRELIESLYAEAERQVEALRGEARAQAERAREAAREKLRLRRLEFERMLADCSARDAGCLLKEAREKAEAAQLASWEELSRRLYRTALSMLHTLRDGDYGKKQFKALAAELPPFRWETVKVNPLDRGLCPELFPGAEVVAEPSISGGMEVGALGGKVRAINTFEKRLERLWTELVPLLIEDVSRRMKDGKTH